jgi:hypothetical protein
MEFIETSVFTRQITELLTDAEYKQLQHELLLNPLVGDLIKHSGGLRKLRCKAKGKGKRGGIRVIYYYLTEDEKIFMLYAYSKSRKDDLDANELKMLREAVKEELSWKRRCSKN